MLAAEYILIDISLLSCSPGLTNKSQQKNITSTSVILLGFCSRLKDHGIPAQQKAPDVGRKQHLVFKMDRNEIDQIIEYMELDDSDTLFEGWHHHPDLKGDGNKDWPTRKIFLSDLVDFYNELKARVIDYPKPFQLWIWILERDSAQDAVFFSAEHPDNKSFPITIDRIGNFAITNTFLKQYIDRLGFQIIPDIYENELQYYLFDPAVGIPLNK